jgi:hypothetical protein
MAPARTLAILLCRIKIHPLSKNCLLPTVGTTIVQKEAAKKLWIISMILVTKTVMCNRHHAAATAEKVSLVSMKWRSI